MRNGAHRCPRCGGEHRAMEVCPEAPDYFQLLRMWVEGDRQFMTWLAFSATLALIFIVALAVFTAGH